MSEEEEEQESSQSERIWSVPSLTDSFAISSNSVRVTDRVEVVDERPPSVALVACCFCPPPPNAEHIG